MDTRFRHHNTHLEEPDRFAQLDPQLRELSRQPLVHRSRLLNRLRSVRPSIYTITGGRQIGKTTLLKQWMETLLRSGVDPQCIVFFTGELIDDHHSLVSLVSSQLDEMPRGETRYLLLDEITYIRDWDKGIKYLADAGLIEDCVVLLTGSDSSIIREARTRFPGRRGRQNVVDYELFPLSFPEVVMLKKSVSETALQSLVDPDYTADASLTRKLFAEFDEYLIHGGFLTAINDMARGESILPATFAVYSDWIRGDVLKRGKHEHYLREVLGAIEKRLGSQVTWNNLAQDLSIDHPQTVADYIALLAAMDVVFVQPALLEDKLTAAPKKARKLHFTDPFIRHAVRSWLHPVRDPFSAQVQVSMVEGDHKARLAESCAVTHVRRRFQTFYIKAKGEVDIAYLRAGRFWPVEVKWTQQIRPGEIRQITKYDNGCIWDRCPTRRSVHGIPTEPLPIALVRLGLEPAKGE